MTRILVIDDEDPIRANLARLLRLEGFEVDAAADGLEGLELARAHRPDAVLCDIVMTGLDGYGVLAVLRADPATAALPFVFLTASADPDERERCLRRGAQAYLAKPFNLRQVLETLRQCLRAD